MKHASFATALENIAGSSATSASLVTDGLFDCKYSEILGLLKDIDEFLDVRGVDPDTSIALECPNTLAGALLSLALLRKGNSFLLVPPATHNNTDLKPIPRFCQYHLIAAPTESPRPDAFSPTSCFRLYANESYNGRPGRPGRLYLRTSGSMGVSKIVVHTHERLLGNARNVARKYGFSADSRAAIPVPIAHMYGFGAEFLPSILAGASVDLQERTNLVKYLDREKRFQPTIVFATPAICDMLRTGYKSPRTHYDVFVTSGQRIPEELFRAFDPLVGGRLVNQYGSSEMGAISACDPGDDLDARVATIGRPMDGVQLRIDSVENGDSERSGAELFCHHPYGFEGYVDEEGEWLQRVPPDGWHRTGDLALTHVDGSIIVTGRADASVNRRGYLVLLSDIERIMEKLDALSTVVVVAGREEWQGQRIAAFCVPRPSALVDGGQLRERCFDLMPHYAIPDEVRVTSTLPLLPTGKVDRRQLTALIGSAPSSFC